MASPFSLSHGWKVKWNRERVRPREVKIPSELHPMLYAVASVGVIGGVQLKRLFDLNTQKLKQLCREYHFLMRHELSHEKNIPIYTLGTNAIHTFQLPPNYWLHWQAEDVLKCMVFFKLYEVFLDYEPEIVPSLDPFVGAMQIGEKLYYVFVARDDVYDLLLYMKWNKNPEQRIIVVAEKLEYLSPLNPFLSDFRIRATTDEDLTEGTSLDEMFYEWTGDAWVKNESIYQK
ncbi:hypothetical protein GCM10010965_14700 [Caldalkalibacillus thermarum]|uniref:hypothetical protein n=1 Tax=Caldalkalibacillus thermarum TaxID=296745 RepID=UPI00166F34C9|nr:hypothetical protein [Caldalkalibacillus thermarum]GGK22877.1 hypothetical protein GCM10010965_14700 [Caldalkalibacillus thermarum]